jgi:hypothetical protein
VVTKESVKALSLAIQALAEKYDISKSAVVSILSELPEEVLSQANWKDLDAIVQEGLVSPGYTGEAEEEVTELNFSPFMTRGKSPRFSWANSGGEE